MYVRSCVSMLTALESLCSLFDKSSKVICHWLLTRAKGQNLAQGYPAGFGPKAGLELMVPQSPA